MPNDISAYLNRDLSWLEFNQRVLDEAMDESNPPFERLKFLSITARNLDEFFMVRIGAITHLVNDGVATPDETGYPPANLLEAIQGRVTRMVAMQYSCYSQKIIPILEKEGIRQIPLSLISKRQQSYIEQLMSSQIESIVTPQAIDQEKPFPLLMNLKLHLAVRLAPVAESYTPRYALIPLGPSLSRIVTIPSESGFQYLLLEEIVTHFIRNLFSGETVEECVPFRITRNAEVSIVEDGASDLIDRMQDVLDLRRSSACIRLEISQTASSGLVSFLQKNLGTTDSQIYRISGPLALGDFFSLSQINGFGHCKAEPWPPCQSIELGPEESMFHHIKKGDILLYHPYESFDPVVRLIQEAAEDPGVLAIKQILYRTAQNSAIIAALQEAADAGKYVTVLVELKARFDEARNMEWAQQLEQAGATVIYGVKGLKTHAKATLIVRKEEGVITRYMHFGTGNYNESTARLYGDISYFTAKNELGNDLSAFFNAITGYSQPQLLQKLYFSPVNLNEHVLQLIYHEKERQEHGQKSHIMAKLNSLVDTKIIEALYDASRSGVRIQLNVRGVCCLKPGVKGMSDNITVTSIVDRFLEHARILYFYHGGDEKFYISSADWMPRNLKRRIELLVPVDDPQCQARLRAIFDLHFSDTVKARHLLPDGTYKKAAPSSKQKQIRSQERLYESSIETAQKKKKSKKTTFEPHKPRKTSRERQ